MKKLVRDKIPEIIKLNGEKPNFYIADKIEYKEELYKKLIEESKEVIKTNNNKELIEEIADVYEVLNYIIKLNNINISDIEKIRIEKKEKRGGFKNRIILK